MKKLLLLAAVVLMGAGCSTPEQSIATLEGQNLVCTDGNQKYYCNVNDNHSKEPIVTIPLKEAQIEGGKYTSRFIFKQELPLSQAVQMLIDYQGLKYVPEETSTTEAKLVR